METSRIDKVKAPQHLKTRRARLLGRLPLGQLAQALLAGPDGRVHDLQEELARPRVKHKNGAVDGLRRQVALEGLVDRHAVDLR